MTTKSRAGGQEPPEAPKRTASTLPDATPAPPQGQETQGRPAERDDRTPEQRAGSDTESAQDAANAPPTIPPAATAPEKVDVLQRTITTLGEVTHETRPGFDAGGTPVIPNAPLRDRIAEIGDYPRSYEDAVLLARHRAGEVDEYGKERDQEQADDDEGDKPSEKREG